MWTTSPVWENIQRQTDWQWTSQCGAQTAIGPLLTKLIRRRTRCCCHSSTTASRCSTSREAAASRSCSRSCSTTSSCTMDPPSGSTQTDTQRRRHSPRSHPVSGCSTESTWHAGLPPTSTMAPSVIFQQRRTSRSGRPPPIPGRPVEGHQVATTTRRLTPRAHRRAGR